MDARDFVRMQYERRLREGLEDTSVHSQTIGSFERFTKVSGCFLRPSSVSFFSTVTFDLAKFLRLPSDLSSRDLVVA